MQILVAAIQAHTRGDLDVAERGYRSVLAAEPEHFDALQLLAALLGVRGEHDEALGLFDRAIGINAGHAVMFMNRGNVLRDLGRAEEALASYDQALRLQPNVPEMLTFRSNALHDLGRLKEAMAGYDQALQAQPGLVEAWINRGATLVDLGQIPAALDSYDRALKLVPDHPDAHNNRGLALERVGRHAEALLSFQRALRGRPQDPVLQFSIANALTALRRPAEALAAFDAALALRSNWPEAWNGRGNALLRLDRPGAALAAYRKALEYKPDYLEALGNCGLALAANLQTEAALEAYDQALAVAPDHAELHFHRACCRLLTGDLSEGWAEYEWRHRRENALPARAMNRPVWLGGEELAGRSVLVHCEQGFGDTLQFSRFLRPLVDLGAHVMFEVPPPLFQLMASAAKGWQVIPAGSPLPPFDLHCPLMSLPLALGIAERDIQGAPYLHADPQRVELWRGPPGGHQAITTSTESLRAAGSLRIGLIWSGNPRHENDGKRSLPLSRFLPLLDPRDEWYCLQKDVRPEDVAAWSGLKTLRDPRDRLADFSDTAALCATMDLVISVDSSVAHLAGALGSPVWLLLPFHPDWRWMLDRSDTPWYDSMELFRQAAPGDWDSVFATLAERLDRLR